MTTKRPSPDSRSAGHAALASRNGLVSRSASIASQRSSGKSSIGATCWKPAFGTTASRRPKRSRAAATASRLPARVVRSAANGSPGPSSSGSRSTASTRAPSSTSRWATARPMPLAAPVTRTACSPMAATVPDYDVHNVCGGGAMTVHSKSYEDVVAEHEWRVPEHYNIAQDCCDKHPPDKLAMIHEDFAGTVREVHWGELQELSNRFANVLRAHRVAKGDRVAMLLPPTPETAAAFFGTWKCGAILLSMSVLYGDDGIRHRLTDSQPKVLVTNDANAGRIDPSLVEHVLRLDADLLASGDSAFAPEDTLAEDPAQLYYTSGTTGLAKGIVHAQRYLLAHEEFVYCHEVQDGELFHGMGEWAWAAGIAPLLGPWRLGAVQVVYQRQGGFDPHKQLDFLSRHGVTNVFTTPTAMRSMMSISDAGTRYPQKFRRVCSAGEPLNPEAIRWFREQYGITVLDYYGLTESYPLVANYPFMEVREGSMGRPMPGWDVQILDEDEQPVAQGE